jgi:AraC family transcriptional regulator
MPSYDTRAMKHILRKRELGGLEIVEALYPPNFRQPRHTHARASFSFVLGGSYFESYGGQPLTRQASTVVLHPPQESHAVEYRNEPVRILSVQMDATKLSYLKDRAVVFDSRASRRSDTIDWLGHRLYQEFLQADSFSALALEGLVFEMLAEASRMRARLNQQAPRWLRRAEEFLHDNFTASLVFGDVARSVGVHPVHLARVFRKNHGCTIGEYVRRLRLEFAARQIVGTDTPLGAIAMAAGFADQSHLTNAFKAHFGFTPSAYRRLESCSATKTLN